MPTKHRHFDDNDPRLLACRKAVKDAGGYRALARLLKVSPQAIFLWQMVPPERCQAVAIITGMSVYELRPDIFGAKPTRRAE
jgi:DNA-binding transcriptional regulator YdaS (Cro superfamily)